MFQGIPNWLIFTIGFIAQFFFTARTLLQWFLSEKSKKVSSPTSYWIFSVIGSWTMFFYGVLRNDFSIILGQLISYYIYLWNLNAKGVWKKLHAILKAVLLLTPVVAVILLLKDAGSFLSKFLNNAEIPLWMVIYGSAGQIIFTLRFIYQWAYSEKKHESVLPAGFWMISLFGSAVIISYGIFRKDPVLILGQSFGFIAYTRNLMIWYSSKKKTNAEKQ
ncbi:MAG: lipid-A-disaccharide synthase N-terminal domain-containing protein [Bacteroidales bacterium]|nr:lipid-A-disaccharide synthase N-terminal domain-containing protein [Bacteroidales bacterium]